MWGAIHMQGFIQAILMSCRWYKKLDLLSFEFFNLHSIYFNASKNRFTSRLHWKWVSLLFWDIYPPDVKKFKIFKGLFPLSCHYGSAMDPLLSLQCLQVPTFNVGQFCNIFLKMHYSCEYISVWCIWLYVIIMSHTHFRVNLHYSCLNVKETGPIYEV